MMPSTTSIPGQCTNVSRWSTAQFVHNVFVHQSCAMHGWYNLLLLCTWSIKVWPPDDQEYTGMLVFRRETPKDALYLQRELVCSSARGLDGNIMRGTRPPKRITYGKYTQDTSALSSAYLPPSAHASRIPSASIADSDCIGS